MISGWGKFDRRNGEFSTGVDNPSNCVSKSRQLPKSQQTERQRWADFSRRPPLFSGVYPRRYKGQRIALTRVFERVALVRDYEKLAESGKKMRIDHGGFAVRAESTQ